MAVEKPSFLDENRKDAGERKVGRSKGIVKLDLNVYKTIIASMTRYSNPRIPEDEWIEAMGLLYGYNDGDDVVITECVPFTHTKKEGHILRVQFDQEDYVLATEIENQFIQREPPQFIVGWVHSHPGIVIMLTQDDIKNHLAWQTNNPNAIALVFNHQRLLRQEETPRKRGDPKIPLELDPGFKIFRLTDPKKGLESNYDEVEYQFSDFPLNQELITNAKEFCLWVAKAFPREDAVVTEYEEYINKTLSKLEDIYTGTKSYIETLHRKGEHSRIPEIVDKEKASAKSIIEKGSQMVQIFRMMPPYLEYKERSRLVPQIDAILGKWDQKIDGFLQRLEDLKDYQPSA